MLNKLIVVVVGPKKFLEEDFALEEIISWLNYKLIEHKWVVVMSFNEFVGKIRIWLWPNCLKICPSINPKNAKDQGSKSWTVQESDPQWTDK